MSDTVDKFTDALKDRGIDVDSTMSMGPGLSLMYEHDPERAQQDAMTTALLYAEVPQVGDPLSVTVIDTSGPTDERVANYAVSRDLARRYNDGELSDIAYANEVWWTWSEYQ